MDTKSKDGLGEMIKSVADVITVAMRDAPPWLKAVELFGSAGILLAAYLCSQFIQAKNTHYAFWTGIIALALLVVVVIVLLVVVAIHIKDEDTPPAWSISVPKLPLDPPVLEVLRGRLLETHHVAYHQLKLRNATIEDHQIRANIFLVDYRNAQEGVSALCVLKMIGELQVNMSYIPESSIQFQLGQGATGQAFLTKTPKVARRVSSLQGEWEHSYQMTDELTRTVHKDLKWVISMPIKDDSDQVFGVLNVDGLDHNFDDRVLGEVAGFLVLTGNIKACAVELAMQPRVRLTTRVEEVKV